MSSRPPRKGISITDDPFQSAPGTKAPTGTEPAPLAAVPDPPAAKEQILRPGESTFAEKTIKMTWNMPASLNARLAGLVTYVQMNDTPEGFDSSTDIVRYAINSVVKRLEDEYNDGKPFPAPRTLRRGRGAKST
jgi:hypothetical protein